MCYGTAHCYSSLTSELCVGIDSYTLLLLSDPCTLLYIRRVIMCPGLPGTILVWKPLSQVPGTSLLGQQTVLE